MYTFCDKFANRTSVIHHGVLSNECFVDGVSILPHILLILFSLPVLVSWTKSLLGNIHATTWVNFRGSDMRWTLALCLMLFNILEIAEGVMTDRRDEHVHFHLYMPHCVAFLGSVASMFYYHNVERWNSPRFLFLLLLYWPSCFCVRIMKLVYLLKQGVDLNYARTGLSRASITIYLALLLLEIVVAIKMKYLCKSNNSCRPPDGLTHCRFVQGFVSLPSRTTFFWLYRILRAGYRKSIHMGDLGYLPHDETSAFNQEILMKDLAAEKLSEQSGRPVCLLRCIMSSHRWVVGVTGLLKLTADILLLSAPLIIMLIIRFAEHQWSQNVFPRNDTAVEMSSISPNDTSSWQYVTTTEFWGNGYLLCLVLFVILMLHSCAAHAHDSLVIRHGLRIKAALQGMVYGKLLRLPSWAVSDNHLDRRRLLQLMINAPSNILALTCLMHKLWSLPLKMCWGMCILWWLLGTAGLAPGIFLITLYPLQCALALLLAKLNKQASVVNERHVRLCTELIIHLKLVRLRNQEVAYMEKSRDLSLDRIFAKVLIVRCIMVFLPRVSPWVAMVMGVVLYPSGGDTSMLPSQAFPALALCYILTLPLHVFPMAVTSAIVAAPSLGQLTEFLQQEELKGYIQETSQQDDVQVRFQLGGSVTPVASRESSPGTSPRLMPASFNPWMSDHSPSVAHRSLLEPPHHLEVLAETDEEDEGGMIGGHRHRKLKTKHNRKPRSRSPSPSPRALTPTDDENIVKDIKRRKSESKIRSRPSSGRKRRKSEESSSSDGQLIDAPVRRNSKSTDMSDSSLSCGDLLDTDNEKPNTQQQKKKRRASRPDKLDNSISAKNSEKDFSLPRRDKSRSRHSSGVTLTAAGGDDDANSVRDMGVAIEIQNGHFSWNPQAKEPILKNINFKANGGELTVIVGPDGSGKSSLLAALMGEMHHMSGSVTWQSGLSVCYAGQISWILSATLRENIVFGRTMEKKRYRRVLQACGLIQDMVILPAGEETLIGEGGVELSEGQKHRVCLARAMYSRADVVVMDGCLGPLDAHMASQIFEEGVLNFLLRQKRTVIMVTNHVHYVSYANQIYRLESGEISHNGTLQEIKEKDMALFSRWQAAVRLARAHTKTETEDTMMTTRERHLLMHRISSHDILNKTTQTSVLGEMEAHSAAPSRVDSVLQMTNIPGADSAATCQTITTQVSVVSESDTLVKVEGQHETLIPSNQVLPSDHVTCGLVWQTITASRQFVFFLVIIFQTCLIGAVIAADKHLAYWTSENWVSSEAPSGSIPTDSPQDDTQPYYTSRYYASLLLIIALACLMTTFPCMMLGEIAGSDLHSKLMYKVLNAPLRYISHGVVSELTKRLSADIITIESALPATLNYTLHLVAICCGALCLAVLASRLFMLPSFILLALAGFTLKVTWSTIRSIQQLEVIHRAPLTSLLTQSWAGLQTVRGFRDEASLQQLMSVYIDRHSGLDLWAGTIKLWLTFRWESLGALLLACTGVTCVLASEQDSGYVPGFVGLAMAYCFMLYTSVGWLARCSIDIATQLGAVGRTLHNTKTIPQEDCPFRAMKLLPHWPTRGEVRLQDLTVAHDNHAPVLTGITMHIPSHSKVAICGTMGSGKTSLISSFVKFAQVESGQILIDGMNILQEKRDVLCNRIPIVPPAPVLLSIDCTLRSQLDPLRITSDDALWQRLEVLGLKEVTEKLPRKLDTSVEEAENVLTVSQKQLIWLGRYFESPLILLDEPLLLSEGEDGQRVLQALLQGPLKNTTVIVFTELASETSLFDIVAVLHKGALVELGSPDTLRQDQASAYSSMLSDVTRC